MKNDKINRLESLASEGFLAKNQFVPSPEWQNKVISDIKRREHAGKFNKKIQQQSLLQPRLVWRFAAASITVATLICITLYLAVPNTDSNDYQTDEVSFDNFDNYIEIIEQS
jgi:type IV secretory pathway component VirB8